MTPLSMRHLHYSHVDQVVHMCRAWKSQRTQQQKSQKTKLNANQTHKNGGYGGLNLQP